MTTVTIKFRAKLDTFSGGTGYKVPALRPHHVTFSERDTRAVLISTARDMEAALTAYSVDLPGVVWAECASEWCRDTSAWTIKPIGKGFMADVSITVDLVKRKR